MKAESLHESVWCASGIVRCDRDLAMYGCIIDIDARSVTLDHEFRQIRRSYGGLKRMEVTGNAFDRIQDIATAHGFRKFRGSFYVTAMSREQMEAAGYGVHHRSEDGKHLIMGNGTRAFAVSAQEQPDQDRFSIYQLKRGEDMRELRFAPHDRLTATGHTVDPQNYDLVYSAPLTPDMTLGDIWRTFNLDHPADFKGHSLSVSDVVVIHRDGQDKAHYVDSFGYKDVPEFFQPESHIKTAEMSTEQNQNMIDGLMNNTPTAAELEAKAKAGEVISITELAGAIQAEKGRGGAGKEEKPSIRAQLKAAKERRKNEPKKAQTKSKNTELEV